MDFVYGLLFFFFRTCFRDVYASCLVCSMRAIAGALYIQSELRPEKPFASSDKCGTSPRLDSRHSWLQMLVSSRGRAQLYQQRWFLAAKLIVSTEQIHTFAIFLFHLHTTKVKICKVTTVFQRCAGCTVGLPCDDCLPPSGHVSLC